MSTLFFDGPAAGTRLELRRAPLYLRVVINGQGEIDALDQLEDKPEPTEIIHVYRMSANLGGGFCCSRGKGGGCRQFNVNEYKSHTEQPTDDEARDSEKWKAWVTKQCEKETQMAQEKI
jgi:hypothetical protein